MEDVHVQAQDLDPSAVFDSIALWQLLPVGERASSRLCKDVDIAG